MASDGSSTGSAMIHVIVVVVPAVVFGAAVITYGILKLAELADPQRKQDLQQRADRRIRRGKEHISHMLLWAIRGETVARKVQAWTWRRRRYTGRHRRTSWAVS